jgi:hypothetical protein
MKYTTTHTVVVMGRDGSCRGRRFRVEIDTERAVNTLAQKAVDNKSFVSKECDGAVVVTALDVQ